MFIRKVKKKNPGYEKVFVYHRLIESFRTSKGPRQRLLLDLGRLDLPPEEWGILANCIEDITTGKQWLIEPPQHIKELAQHYAQFLIRKGMSSAPVSPKAEQDWETVDLNSISNSECRTIGGEAVAYHAYNKLGIPEILSELGFSEKQMQQTALLVIGRLLHPGSERERFEAGLKSITDALARKGGIKKYPRVMERLGRLREKYSTISQFYQIEVQREGEKAKSITWSFDQGKAKTRFSGSYYIRTNRQELSEVDLWSLYIMLTQVENAFRCLKSELGFRPVYPMKYYFTG